MASTWQVVNVGFCTMNIMAAFYIAMRFNHLRNHPAESSSGGNTQASGLRKASDILCYDPVVAIYILILIGFFVWLSIGISWRSSGQMWCGDDGSYALIHTSLACGYSFFGTGFFALCFSICCSCCCNDDRRGPNPYYSPNNRYGSTAGAGGASRPSSYQRPQAPQNPGASNTSSYNNDVEYGAATATPEPVTATPIYSKQSTNDGKHNYTTSAQQEQAAAPIQATVVTPSAPPMTSHNGSSDGGGGGLTIDQEADAVAKGSAFGAKIGKMFHATDTTQAKLETAGAKANVAVNQGITKAQQMFAGFKKK